ncbi:MAG: hypothetical protein AAF628_11940 [Planctomycetota bacterium]
MNLWLVVLCSWLALGGSGEPSAARAVQAVRAGDDEAALVAFAAALEEGAEAAAVRFNMGACAYRLGRYGEAVWHLELARTSLPRAPQVIEQLDLARRALGIEPPRVGVFDALSADELLWLAVVAQALGVLGLVLARARGARGLAIGLVVVAWLGFGAVGRREWWGPTRAVVLAERLEVRSAPARGAPVQAVLRSGAMVALHATSDRWVLLAGGTEGAPAGWVHRRGLGLLDGAAGARGWRQSPNVR